MGTIQTVLGPVESGSLGFTLMHEHIMVRTPGVADNFPTIWDRAAEIDYAATALSEARAVGVQTLVDATTFEMGRDVEFMAEVARRSDLRVIASTGVWLEPPPYFQSCDVDQIAELFVREIEAGIASTGIKAGIIKCATDVQGVTPIIEKALRAAARAHRATGVPITTHTDAAKEMGTLQQDIFESEGVDLKRVIIGHSGDSTDIAYLARLMGRGSYIGMDRFGLDNFLPTAQRVATIASLCGMGHSDRLVLSQDAICYVEWWNRTAMRQALPNWHHSYLAGEVLAELIAAGVTDEQIDRMTIANPRSIFERCDPY